ncbi:hypothetical protein HFC70_05605 [Agrobacterium sp. a22-2]|uniref:hypothetical protein n=1 Tax=Agrobacterium sp. a22-2 TaxID=2283840 RepID=UPI001447F924|nr:hypothetical protein [Agrobacterium sp. a22-2]NKN35827.1 hypothetical protein [Agrobacterium sp. a22-2]
MMHIIIKVKHDFWLKRKMADFLVNAVLSRGKCGADCLDTVWRSHDFWGQRRVNGSVARNLHHVFIQQFSDGTAASIGPQRRRC